jgi:L-lactate permease
MAREVTTPMNAVTASAAFGLSLPDLAAAALALGYVVSLVKDWRPIRTLRAENRELRSLCEAGDKKIVTLEAQVAVLQKATNLSAFQEEQRHIADTLERVAAKLDSLDGAVKANTAAVELIASGSALRQTIEDMNPKEAA